jgi:hydrogenase small subunit
MVDRREFLKMAAVLGATFGLGGWPRPVAAALKGLDPASLPKLIYLQGLSCTGCSISLLQATSPEPAALITQYSKLAFHADLSAISGQGATELIEQFIAGEAGEYFLAVEGAIPARLPEACLIGDKPFTRLLEAAAATMSGAIAVGTCASFGGIPAADGNLTGAIGLGEFFRQLSIDKPLITIPGCPPHPDWVWHTVIHLVQVGMPELTGAAPKLFYGRKVHESCPRYHDFQQEIFARKLGEKGCLFKLGCLGPDTRADCPTRGWNGGPHHCINANAPCIGCASPFFARKKNFPFYRLTESHQKS